jgi:hypothetical protein
MLLGLYPRAFREQLGESMEQTFADLYGERKRRTKPGVFSFVLWTLVDTAGGIVKEHTRLLTQGPAMKNALTHPRSAALLSLALMLPGALLFSLLLLGIDPPLGPLAPLLNTPDDRPEVLGTAIALLLIVLLPVAVLVLNLPPIVRNVRAGNSIMAAPVNLVLAGAALLILLTFVIGIVVDQYPCWIGVPNCD